MGTYTSVGIRSQLVIEPSGRLDSIFFFKRFIALLPRLTTVCVYWQINSNASIYLATPSTDEQGAVDAHQSPLKAIPVSPSSTLLALKIKTIYGIHFNHGNAPSTMYEQLRCLLRHLQSQLLCQPQTVSISLEAPDLLDASDPDLEMSSLVDACNELNVSNLNEASLQIRLYFSGFTEEIDTLVS